MKKIKLFFRRMCIIVVFLLIITMFINNMKLKIFYKTEYSEYVEKYSTMYNVDEKLVYAVIKNESNFNSNAISRVGAKGLMQIMDSTAEDVAKELELEEYNLLSPEDNIKIGIKYLSDLIEKYGEISLALAAYNAGFGTVDTWITDGVISAEGNDYENIPYKETNMYVRKILRDYDIYITKIS